MSKLLYNIASKEGDRTSVTVFIGDKSHVATADHPRFNEICDYLLAGNDDSAKVQDMFDVTPAIAKRFDRLSERVSVGAGRVFFDGDEVDDALTQAIVRAYVEDPANTTGFMPLVNFMEKIAMNPNEHSRKMLFVWLSKHSYGIAADGDLIAYKGIGTNDLSSHSGQATVNGELIKGHIPNRPDTIIEMPRSEVQHDPKVGCHTGLHVGNWRYASTFASKTVRVKVNPRDVVSVPTDSNDEKMRVCRYRVLASTVTEDKTLMFVQPPDRLAVAPTKPTVSAPTPTAKADKPAADKPRTAPQGGPRRGGKGKPAPAPAKPQGKAQAPKATPERDPNLHYFPDFYEEFTKKDWDLCTMKEMTFVAKEFGISPLPKTKDEMTAALIKAGRARKRTWA